MNWDSFLKDYTVVEMRKMLTWINKESKKETGISNIYKLKRADLIQLIKKNYKEKFLAGGEMQKANKGMWLMEPHSISADTYFLKMKGEMLKKAMKEEPKKVMKEQPKKEKKKVIKEEPKKDKKKLLKKKSPKKSDPYDYTYISGNKVLTVWGTMTDSEKESYGFGKPPPFMLKPALML